MAMQDLLKKTMQGMGKVVEGVAKPFQKKGLGSSASQVQIQLQSNACTIPEYKIKKLLSLCERKELTALLPSLSSKLFLCYQWGEEKFYDLFLKKGAGQIFEMENDYSTPPANLPKGQNLERLKVDLSHLPFQPASVDVLLSLNSGLKKNDYLLWFEEVSRVLKDGGRAVISLMHPSMEQSFNPNLKFAHRFEKYFSETKKHHLYIEELKEIVVEDSFKSACNNLSEQEFSMLKGMPAVLMIKVARLKRQSKSA